jgi:hypothetical protein
MPKARENTRTLPKTPDPADCVTGAYPDGQASTVKTTMKSRLVPGFKVKGLNATIGSPDPLGFPDTYVLSRTQVTVGPRSNPTLDTLTP